MERIFDAQVQQYLKSVGISQKEISRLEYEEYKKAMLSILEKVTKAISEEDMATLDELCDWSPAGDGHGTDNNYISFSKIDNDDRTDGVDIVVALEKLKQYQNNKNSSS